MADENFKIGVELEVEVDENSLNNAQKAIQKKMNTPGGLSAQKAMDTAINYGPSEADLHRARELHKLQKETEESSRRASREARTYKRAEAGGVSRGHPRAIQYARDEEGKFITKENAIRRHYSRTIENLDDMTTKLISRYHKLLNEIEAFGGKLGKFESGQRYAEFERGGQKVKLPLPTLGADARGLPFVTKGRGRSAYSPTITGKVKPDFSGFEEVTTLFDDLIKDFKGIKKQIDSNLRFEKQGGAIRDSWNKKVNAAMEKLSQFKADSPREAYQSSQMRRFVSAPLSKEEMESYRKDRTGFMRDKAVDVVEELRKNPHLAKALGGTRLSPFGASEGQGSKIEMIEKKDRKGRVTEARMVLNLMSDALEKFELLGKAFTNPGRTIAQTFQSQGQEFPAMRSPATDKTIKEGLFGMSGYGKNMYVKLVKDLGAFEDQILVSKKAIKEMGDMIYTQTRTYKVKAGTATVKEGDVFRPGSVRGDVNKKVDLKTGKVISSGDEATTLGTTYATTQRRGKGGALEDVPTVVKLASRAAEVVVDKITEGIEVVGGEERRVQYITTKDRFTLGEGSKLTAAGSFKGVIKLVEDLGNMKITKPFGEMAADLLDVRNKAGLSADELENLQKRLRDAGNTLLLLDGSSKKLREDFEKATGIKLGSLSQKAGVGEIGDLTSLMKAAATDSSVREVLKRNIGQDLADIHKTAGFEATKEVPIYAAMSAQGAGKRGSTALTNEMFLSNILGEFKGVIPDEMAPYLKGGGASLLQGVGRGGMTDAAGRAFLSVIEHPLKYQKPGADDLIEGRKGGSLNAAAFMALDTKFGKGSSFVGNIMKMTDTKELHEAKELIQSVIEDVSAFEKVPFNIKSMKALPKDTVRAEDLAGSILDPELIKSKFMLDIPDLYGSGGYSVRVPGEAGRDRYKNEFHDSIGLGTVSRSLNNIIDAFHTAEAVMTKSKDLDLSSVRENLVNELDPKFFSEFYNTGATDKGYEKLKGSILGGTGEGALKDYVANIFEAAAETSKSKRQAGMFVKTALRGGAALESLEGDEFKNRVKKLEEAIDPAVFEDEFRETAKTFQVGRKRLGDSIREYNKNLALEAGNRVGDIFHRMTPAVGTKVQIHEDLQQGEVRIHKEDLAKINEAMRAEAERQGKLSEFKELKAGSYMESLRYPVTGEESFKTVKIKDVTEDNAYKGVMGLSGFRSVASMSEEFAQQLYEVATALGKDGDKLLGVFHHLSQNLDFDGDTIYTFGALTEKATAELEKAYKNSTGIEGAKDMKGLLNFLQDAQGFMSTLQPGSEGFGKGATATREELLKMFQTHLGRRPDEIYDPDKLDSAGRTQYSTDMTKLLSKVLVAPTTEAMMRLPTITSLMQGAGKGASGIDPQEFQSILSEITTFGINKALKAKHGADPAASFLVKALESGNLGGIKADISKVREGKGGAMLEGLSDLMKRLDLIDAEGGTHSIKSIEAFFEELFRLVNIAQTEAKVTSGGDPGKDLTMRQTMNAIAPLYGMTRSSKLLDIESRMKEAGKVMGLDEGVSYDEILREAIERSIGMGPNALPEGSWIRDLPETVLGRKTTGEAAAAQLLPGGIGSEGVGLGSIGLTKQQLMSMIMATNTKFFEGGARGAYIPKSDQVGLNRTYRDQLIHEIALGTNAGLDNLVKKVGNVLVHEIAHQSVQKRVTGKGGIGNKEDFYGLGMEGMRGVGGKGGMFSIVSDFSKLLTEKSPDYYPKERFGVTDEAGNINVKAFNEVLSELIARVMGGGDTYGFFENRGEDLIKLVEAIKKWGIKEDIDKAKGAYKVDPAHMKYIIEQSGDVSAKDATLLQSLGQKKAAVQALEGEEGWLGAGGDSAVTFEQTWGPSGARIPEMDEESRKRGFQKIEQLRALAQAAMARADVAPDAGAVAEAGLKERLKATTGTVAKADIFRKLEAVRQNMIIKTLDEAKEQLIDIEAKMVSTETGSKEYNKLKAERDKVYATIDKGYADYIKLLNTGLERSQKGGKDQAVLMSSVVEMDPHGRASFIPEVAQAGIKDMLGVRPATLSKDIAGDITKYTGTIINGRTKDAENNITGIISVSKRLNKVWGQVIEKPKDMSVALAGTALEVKRMKGELERAGELTADESQELEIMYKWLQKAAKEAAIMGEQASVGAMRMTPETMRMLSPQHQIDKQMKEIERQEAKMGKSGITQGMSSVKVLDESGKPLRRFRVELKATGYQLDEGGKKILQFRRKWVDLDKELARSKGFGQALRRVVMWGSAAGLVYGSMRAFRMMYDVIQRTEYAILELQKVMNASEFSFSGMRDAAVGFAKEFGAPLEQTTEAMVVFAQQGLGMADVIDRTRTSVLASNVSTLKAQEATESLTSAMKQFEDDGKGSIKFLDAWVSVARRHAITSENLAQALMKAGTAAKNAGVSFDEFNGMVTAIGSVTRQTGKEIGTSLRFVFQRIRVPKAEKALQGIGITTTEGGDLKEVDKIMAELYGKWGSLTEAQKLATAQAIGGIRHYNSLMVLMENYGEVLSATADSLNSQGEAERANSIIMESVAKKMEQLKASASEMALVFGDAIIDPLKFFIDTLKGLIGVLNSIPDAAKKAVVAFGALGLGGMKVGRGIEDIAMYLTGGTLTNIGGGLADFFSLGAARRGIGDDVADQLKRSHAILPAFGGRGGLIGRNMVPGTDFSDEIIKLKKMPDLSAEKFAKSMSKVESKLFSTGEAAKGMNTILGKTSFRMMMLGDSVANTIPLISGLGASIQKSLFGLGLLGVALAAVGYGLYKLYEKYQDVNKTGADVQRNIEVEVAKRQDQAKALSASASLYENLTLQIKAAAEAQAKYANTADVDKAVSEGRYKSPLLAASEIDKQIGELTRNVAKFRPELVVIDELGNFTLKAADSFYELNKNAQYFADLNVFDKQAEAIRAYVEELTGVQGFWNKLLQKETPLERLGAFEKKIADLKKIGALEAIPGMGSKLADERGELLAGTKDKPGIRQAVTAIESSLRQMPRMMTRDFQTQMSNIFPTAENMSGYVRALGMYEDRDISESQFLMRARLQAAGAGSYAGYTTEETVEKARQKGLDIKTLAEVGAENVRDNSVVYFKTMEDGMEKLVTGVVESTKSGRVIRYMKEGGKQFSQMFLDGVDANSVKVIDAAGKMADSIVDRFKDASRILSGAGTGTLWRGEVDLGAMFNFNLSAQQRAAKDIPGMAEFIYGSTELQDELKELQKQLSDAASGTAEYSDAEADVEQRTKQLKTSFDQLREEFKLQTDIIRVASTFSQLRSTLEEAAFAAEKAAAAEEIRRSVMTETVGALAGVEMPSNFDMGKYDYELSAAERMFKRSPGTGRRFNELGTQVDFNIKQAQAASNTLLELKRLQELYSKQGISLSDDSLKKAVATGDAGTAILADGMDKTTSEIVNTQKIIETQVGRILGELPEAIATSMYNKEKGITAIDKTRIAGIRSGEEARQQLNSVVPEFGMGEYDDDFWKYVNKTKQLGYNTTIGNFRNTADVLFDDKEDTMPIVGPGAAQARLQQEALKSYKNGQLTKEDIENTRKDLLGILNEELEAMKRASNGNWIGTTAERLRTAPHRKAAKARAESLEEFIKALSSPGGEGVTEDLITSLYNKKSSTKAGGGDDIAKETKDYASILNDLMQQTQSSVSATQAYYTAKAKELKQQQDMIRISARSQEVFESLSMSFEDLAYQGEKAKRLFVDMTSMDLAMGRHPLSAQAPQVLQSGRGYFYGQTGLDRFEQEKERIRQEKGTLSYAEGQRIDFQKREAMVAYDQAKENQKLEEQFGTGKQALEQLEVARRKAESGGNVTAVRQIESMMDSIKKELGQAGEIRQTRFGPKYRGFDIEPYSEQVNKILDNLGLESFLTGGAMEMQTAFSSSLEPTNQILSEINSNIMSGLGVGGGTAGPGTSPIDDFMGTVMGGTASIPMPAATGGTGGGGWGGGGWTMVSPSAEVRAAAGEIVKPFAKQNEKVVRALGPGLAGGDPTLIDAITTPNAGRTLEHYKAMEEVGTLGADSSKRKAKLEETLAAATEKTVAAEEKQVETMDSLLETVKDLVSKTDVGEGVSALYTVVSEGFNGLIGSVGDLAEIYKSVGGDAVGATFAKDLTAVQQEVEEMGGTVEGQANAIDTIDGMVKDHQAQIDALIAETKDMSIKEAIAKVKDKLEVIKNKFEQDIAELRAQANRAEGKANRAEAKANQVRNR